MSLKTIPFNDKQLNSLNELMQGATAEQLIWLSGYLEGRAAGLNPGNSEIVMTDNSPIVLTEPIAKLTILYGSETGNSKELAVKMAEKATFKNISAQAIDMYEYNATKLIEEENLAIIVSTHGEGDPPDMAEQFYNSILDEEAPQLENLCFSVLALGDKSYKHFCKTGEDIDEALRDLSAYRITPIAKCDVDYEVSSEIWMNNFLLNVTPSEPSDNVEEKETVIDSIVEYSKKKPYLATVLEKVKINGQDSDKEVFHVELSLGDSGLTYEPGDSIGIFTKNPEKLVSQIIEKTALDLDQKVEVKVGEVSLRDALTHHLEITILTFDIIQKYLEKTKNSELEKVLKDEVLLDEYLYGHDLLDLIEEFPFEWNASNLVEILRPLPPRLYSISSSQDYVGDEVHATVSLVKYKNKGRDRQGACTSYLAEEIEVDGEVPMYIDKNPSFKLPLNGAKIIMVGAGTGIAPYRAFMQDRQCKGFIGDTWLFYGDRRLDTDFLYREEWQELLETSHLEKMEVAFSRDQDEKIYVQHKLKENEKEVFEWIENGAHFYLCGDMKYMAKDVNKTLLEIIQSQGGVSEEQAVKFLKNLKREKRFQTDVY